LLALVMQILAPVAPSWAAGIAAADPLRSADICHSDASTGTGDQGLEQYAHDGLCAIGVSYAAAASVGSGSEQCPMVPVPQNLSGHGTLTRRCRPQH
jgi:hypothetical protein